MDTKMELVKGSEFFSFFEGGGGRTFPESIYHSLALTSPTLPSLLPAPTLLSRGREGAHDHVWCMGATEGLKS